MAINKIVKNKLELRAIKLREDENTFEQIADTLTKESNITISYSNVFRFFESYEKTKADLLERQEALKIKYVEADISTIEDRQQIIKGLLKVAKDAYEDRDKVAAYKEANVALDSLDKRLGKLSQNPNETNVNIITVQEQVNAARADVASRIDSITVRLRERGILQQFDGTTIN